MPNPYFQYVEQKLGIAPLTMSYWGNDAYEQYARSQLNSGDIPEALQLYSTEFTQELIKQGLLFPLDDLLPKHAPRIWKMYTQK